MLVESTRNISSTNLEGGSSFVGEIEDVSAYSSIRVSLQAVGPFDVLLYIEFSHNGTVFDVVDTFYDMVSDTVHEGVDVAKVKTVKVKAKYCRLRVENIDGIATTTFNLKAYFATDNDNNVDIGENIQIRNLNSMDDAVTIESGVSVINTSDSTAHTKLDTIDITLSNGLVVSQSNPTNLRVETTPAMTSIQVIKGESMLSEYVEDSGNAVKYPIVAPCSLYGLHYSLADATSGVIALYDATSGVISSSTPKIVIYMKGNTSEGLTFPGPIVFSTGVGIRGVTGTASTGTGDLNPNNGVTLFYSN